MGVARVRHHLLTKQQHFKDLISKYSHLLRGLEQREVLLSHKIFEGQESGSNLVGQYQFSSWGCCYSQVGVGQSRLELGWRICSQEDQLMWLCVGGVSPTPHHRHLSMGLFSMATDFLQSKGSKKEPLPHARDGSHRVFYSLTSGVALSSLFYIRHIDQFSVPSGRGLQKHMPPRAKVGQRPFQRLAATVMR